MSGFSLDSRNSLGVQSLEVHLTFNQLSHVLLVLGELNDIDVVLGNGVKSIGALNANFLIITLSDVLVRINEERHALVHSHVTESIGVLTVVVQNLTFLDWAVQVILVVEP